MRVVHVATAFPRDGEDVITPWLVEMIRRSRERGIEAEVLTSSYRGSGDHRLSGIPVRRFRYAPSAWETLTHDETAPDRVRRSPLHAALVPLYLAGGCAAAWRMGRDAPDLVHVHWPVPHALFGAAMRTASSGRTALVCSYYAVEVNWVLHRMRWLRPFLRWSARTADAVTAISTSTADAVRKVSGRDPRIVPFAAALGEEEATGPGGTGRVPLASSGPLRLLFVGRLVERKGIEVLVRALPRLLEERDVRLTVVGEGEREASLRATARDAGVEDRVEFTGFVSREELSRRYASCDMFVLPAVVDRKGDTEGLGVVLLEALRHERPVVASRAGGITDIVEDGRTGWLVPPGDPAALARRILDVAGRPDDARRVARRGREVVEERFGWERILEGLGAAYREAREARRSARRADGAQGREDDAA